MLISVLYYTIFYLFLLSWNMLNTHIKVQFTFFQNRTYLLPPKSVLWKRIGLISDLVGESFSQVLYLCEGVVIFVLIYYSMHLCTVLSKIVVAGFSEAHGTVSLIVAHACIGEN